MLEQKIKQEDSLRIGANIRRIRLERGMGQTELVRRLQLEGIDMTRETLVKIERGTQHIRATQLRASGMCWIPAMRNCCAEKRALPRRGSPPFRA